MTRRLVLSISYTFIMVIFFTAAALAIPQKVFTDPQSGQRTPGPSTREDFSDSVSDLLPDLSEGGRPQEILLAAESSLRVREETASRFRMEDEEDLQWKPIAEDTNLRLMGPNPLWREQSLQYNRGVSIVSRANLIRLLLNSPRSYRSFPGMASLNSVGEQPMPAKVRWISPSPTSIR
jgi:hypothetical protein